MGYELACEKTCVISCSLVTYEKNNIVKICNKKYNINILDVCSLFHMLL